MNKEYYLRPEGNKVFMCCGKANCPSVEINEEGLIEIKDDYGHSVKMKQEEASLISDAVDKINENSRE